MLYVKQPKEKYTDMCIFFDKNFGTDKRDDNRCFRYMYLVYYMLACKAKCFKHYNDYDDFAQFATSKVYLSFLKRYKEGKLDKSIKSLLNYAKASLFPLKQGWLAENYSTVIDPAKKDLPLDTFINEYKEQVQEQYYADNNVNSITEDFLRNTASYIKKEINQSPYSDDVIIRKNLYISCMLTLLNRITLPYAINQQVRKASKNIKKQDAIKIKYIQENREAILGNLDASYNDYVKVLTNKASYNLLCDLSTNKDYYSLSESELNSIILSAYDDYNPKDNNKYKINREEY